MYDIAIIGAGYSGNLVLANLVARLDTPAKILIADNSTFTFQGPPYSTTRMEHLLNVRTKNMGAFASDIGHFYSWLKAAGYKYDENDFVPRKIYGDYLQDIKTKTFSAAQAKNVTIEVINGRAVAVENGADKSIVSFDNGNVIECKKLVLATGNQLAKPTKGVTTEPWFYDFGGLAKYESDKPVVIIGTGLTAVDTILSIFKTNYKGDVVCISRKGVFPMAHTAKGVDIKFDIAPYIDSIVGARPSQIFKTIRKAIRNNKNYPWQSVFDSMRPYHQQIWNVFNQFDQKRILTKYFTLWGVHRHRMAPEIANEVQAHIKSGRLKIIMADYKCAEMGKVNIAYTKTKTADEILTDHIFDCRGLSLKVIDDIFHTIKDIKLAQNGCGVVGDKNYKISAAGKAPIYTIGSCYAGQLFETIAVPELRVQAEKIAENISH